MVQNRAGELATNPDRGREISHHEPRKGRPAVNRVAQCSSVVDSFLSVDSNAFATISHWSLIMHK
jgi:hypothetical protein